MRLPVWISLLLIAAALLPAADPQLPAELEGVGVVERIGDSIDLGLAFTDETDRSVALREYFSSDRPVVLNLVYYNCPMLCNLVLNGQTSTLRQIPWTPGNEFEIVTISIDPSETHELARSKKQAYLDLYKRPAPGWHFLADRDGNVKKLAEQVGFRYRYDDTQKQYAHAAALMVLTPEGKISRYLYGIQYKARDLRLALTEAAESKFGFSIDRILLYCFHYDPNLRSYVLFATNIMRAGGVLVMLVLGFFLWRLFRAERYRAAPTETTVNAQ
ncbi:MAG: SCO family protein [Bryobacteraceae bacterium]|nr:SCO family protein [Bryobacteraceae bacterium]